MRGDDSELERYRDRLAPVDRRLAALEDRVGDRFRLIQTSSDAQVVRDFEDFARRSLRVAGALEQARLTLALRESAAAFREVVSRIRAAARSPGGVHPLGAGGRRRGPSAAGSGRRGEGSLTAASSAPKAIIGHP